MLIQQVIEFELRAPEPPGSKCSPYSLKLLIFMTKQKSWRKIFEWVIIIYC